MAASTWTLAETLGNLVGAVRRVLPSLQRADGSHVNAQAGAHDGLAIEGVAGGTAIPVSGTVTATVDTSALATETTLAAVQALADEVTGGSKAYSADGTLTASDATTYSPPLKVIWATGAGNITAMLEDDTVNVVTFAVTANERVVDFRIKKVMAATTATGISGAQ